MTESEEPIECEQSEQPEGCPVEMDDGQPCGRPFYNAPAGVDDKPVCLMHSCGPNKEDATFQKEFERILQEAGEGVADFTRFVFPSASYSDQRFKADCRFSGARFVRSAEFRGALFSPSADFSGPRFEEGADFLDAEFAGDACFAEAIFGRGACFFGATFAGLANFLLAEFSAEAEFTTAEFTKGPDFTGASFLDRARLDSVAFRAEADFGWTKFRKEADFGRSLFAGSVRFFKTQFEDDSTSAIFTDCRFENPEGAFFYGTSLAHALFHNCDVSKFNFSVVRWPRRRNGKQMVFDEVALVGSRRIASQGGDRDFEHDCAAIAEVYQQLKKNYDDRRDYWTAGDFHYGEMEMKRMATPPAGRVLGWLMRHKKDRAARLVRKLKRDWHQYMGLAAWYRYLSEYGES